MGDVIKINTEDTEESEDKEETTIFNHLKNEIYSVFGKKKNEKEEENKEEIQNIYSSIKEVIVNYSENDEDKKNKVEIIERVIENILLPSNRFDNRRTGGGKSTHPLQVSRRVSDIIIEEDYDNIEGYYLALLGITHDAPEDKRGIIFRGWKEGEEEIPTKINLNKLKKREREQRLHKKAEEESEKEFIDRLKDIFDKTNISEKKYSLVKETTFDLMKKHNEDYLTYSERVFKKPPQKNRKHKKGVWRSIIKLYDRESNITDLCPEEERQSTGVMNRACEVLKKAWGEEGRIAYENAKEEAYGSEKLKKITDDNLNEYHLEEKSDSEEPKKYGSDARLYEVWKTLITINAATEGIIEDLNRKEGEGWKQYYALAERGIQDLIASTKEETKKIIYRNFLKESISPAEKSVVEGVIDSNKNKIESLIGADYNPSRGSLEEVLSSEIEEEERKAGLKNIVTLLGYYTGISKNYVKKVNSVATKLYSKIRGDRSKEISGETVLNGLRERYNSLLVPNVDRKEEKSFEEEKERKKEIGKKLRDDPLQQTADAYVMLELLNRYENSLEEGEVYSLEIREKEC